MTSPLANQVAEAVGEPSSVRIGTVTQVSPLKVDVQGTEYTNLGRIGPCPAVGQTVALLGQSTAAGSEPTSWLVLGVISTACYPAVFAFSDTVDTTASAVYTIAGAPTVGVSFTVPPAGRVKIHWGAEINNSAAGFTLVSPQVATGAVLGAGTVILAASDANTARSDTVTVFVRSSNFHLLEGLTPDAVLNCTLYHRTGAPVGGISRRRVLVDPAP